MPFRPTHLRYFVTVAEEGQVYERGEATADRPAGTVAGDLAARA